MKGKNWCAWIFVVTAITFLAVPRAESGVAFPVVWTPLTRGGVVMTDPLGDTGVGVAGRDIIGDPFHPGAYVSSDGVNLFFRERVSGNPASNPFDWGVQISSDGNDHNFEYAVVLDGQTSNVLVYMNTGRLDSTGDNLDTLIATFSGASEFKSDGTGGVFC